MKTQWFALAALLRQKNSSFINNFRGEQETHDWHRRSPLGQRTICGNMMFCTAKNLPDLFFRPSVAISQWVFRNAGLIENDGFCLEFRVCNPILNGRGDPFTCRGDTNLGKRPQLDTTWRSLETWRQINLKGDWTTAFPRCQWSQMVAASC